jgi:hypothetical protein
MYECEHKQAKFIAYSYLSLLYSNLSLCIGMLLYQLTSQPHAYQLDLPAGDGVG